MQKFASPLSIGVGLGAGLASALLVLSPAGGSTLAVPLTVLVELPLVIATLGWRTAAGIIAVFAGTGTLLAISPALALYFVLFITPAPVIGSHLLGLARPRAEPNSHAGNESGERPLDRKGREWFPIGQVLLVIAGLVVAGSVLMAVANGFDPSAIAPDKVQALATEYADAMASADASTSRTELMDLVTPAIEATLRILPFAFTATWTLIVCLNLGLGIWITQKSGNLLRPREDFAALDLPRLVAPVMIVTLAIAFSGGKPGALAGTIAGSASALLLVSGLAVLHTITRRLSFRLPLLVLVYLFLGLSAPPLIIVGMLEPYLKLRKRLQPPGPAAPSNF